MTHTSTSRRTVLFGAALLVVQTATTRAADDVWSELRSDIFGESPISEGGPVSLFAPEAASDAATVPVSIRIAADAVRNAERLHLIVDRNPAPVAATFRFGEAFRNGPDVGERRLDTRIRVDSFSQVRAVLKLADGSLHMASRFVAGAGGCSAPASKDLDAAIARLGNIRVKEKRHDRRGEHWREATIMIRHPNFTGMQLDPASGEFTPAWFVHHVEVTADGKKLFEVEGGISISEDPHFRLSFGSRAEDTAIKIRAIDTEGRSFEESTSESGS